MEGPRVSGPWLGIRGGNALALNRPLFKLVISTSIFRVGLCSHTIIFCK